MTTHLGKLIATVGSLLMYSGASMERIRQGLKSLDVELMLAFAFLGAAMVQQKYTSEQDTISRQRKTGRINARPG
ncbi:hypothetical protein H1164_15905 [Thermoactinomyces daqus]|uniref:Uncharacterized protein n=1 Tax=Thermoactinomyces daqus TaxID=1329516 RepID=A0A7W2AIK0_9BACL|nr:hypothetical protein [Thermoactinomyces daqus]MBA4544332.1 hypothetical protein [Thermoactinomyces daqus]